ncbi:hypothetical protein MY4824_007822 [Beauveria thailandica]
MDHDDVPGDSRLLGCALKDGQENPDLPMAEAGREYEVDHSKLRRRRDGSILRPEFTPSRC